MSGFYGRFSHAWSVVTGDKHGISAFSQCDSFRQNAQVSGDCQETMLITFKSDLEVVLTDKRSVTV